MLVFSALSVKSQKTDKLGRISKSCSFIHFVVCLATGLQPLSKRVLHRVRPSAFSFKFQYIFFSSSRVLLLPCHLVSSIFPSIKCFAKQLGRKVFSVQLICLRFIVCRIFLSSLTLCNARYFILHTIVPADVHPSPAPHFETFTVCLLYFPKCSSFSTMPSCALGAAFFLLVSSLIKVQFAGETSLLVERRFCQGSPGFYLTCTSCIACYQAGHIVDIFHIFQFLISSNLHWLY